MTFNIAGGTKKFAIATLAMEARNSLDGCAGGAGNRRLRRIEKSSRRLFVTAQITAK